MARAGAWCVVPIAACVGCNAFSGLGDLTFDGTTSGAGATGAGGEPTGSGGAAGSGGEGAAPSPAGWPDSATIFCTDGTQVSACPSPGAPGYGQDGTVSWVAPAYEENVLTVTDLVNGLEWQRSINPDWLSVDAAEAHCADLTLLGNTDWRLPDVSEILSTLDYGRAFPRMDTALFTDFDAGDLRSSDLDAGDPASAWVVNLAGNVGSVSATSTAAFRCVRGGALPAPYIVQAETVEDPRTGLVWQRTTAAGGYTWLDALDYCAQIAGAGLGGYSDWRLPTAKELPTIVDRTTSNPTIDLTVFPDTPSSLYWTSTPTTDDPPSSAFVVYFLSGSSELFSTDTVQTVRCVRGGR